MTEVWESEAAHEAWISAHVAPTMPVDAPPPSLSFRPIVTVVLPGPPGTRGPHDHRSGHGCAHGAPHPPVADHRAVAADPRPAAGVPDSGRGKPTPSPVA